MLKQFILLAACSMFAAQAESQHPGRLPSKWNPQSGPSDVISFDLLCLAKISKDGKSLQLRVPNYDVKTVEQTFTVQVPFMEQRTRENLVNDQVNTEYYMVQRYTTETRTKTVDVQVPTGPTLVTVPLKNIRAWDLTGKAIEPNALAFKLAIPIHVFAKQVSSDETFRPVDPYFLSVMRTETPVLYFEVPDEHPVPAPPMNRPPDPAPGN